MLNVIALMGRLTREPELRVTPGGTSVCTVTLAVERDYVERGGERETDYIEIPKEKTVKGERQAGAA